MLTAYTKGENTKRIAMVSLIVVVKSSDFETWFKNYDACAGSDGILNAFYKKYGKSFSFSLFTCTARCASAARHFRCQEIWLL